MTTLRRRHEARGLEVREPLSGRLTALPGIDRTPQVFTRR